MSLYCGIDLHANNSYVVVSDPDDEVVLGGRLPNDLGRILGALEPYREELEGIAVESTFNWYWLVDGLRQAGHTVHLVNPLAAQQYQGLKYADDRSDARWLAKMLRLEILPTGWICPATERGVRDLLRKRVQLVRSQHLSNERRKGQGLRKNGNAYLSWAYHEAAHFAVRYQPKARRWYERKRAKTCTLVAIRALAHKLARAAYFMMRDQVPYEPARLFG